LDPQTADSQASATLAAFPFPMRGMRQRTTL
jgi:hypothetical protein